MIITRTPLRISFVGGGSDMPWFYNEEPGSVVSAAIDKYVYVTHSQKYEREYRAAYTRIETVTDISELQHELIRETLKACSLDYYQMGGREIHSIADIPGGTGLGSSSAFTVGLLKAIYPNLLPHSLASFAADIEVNRCKKVIGVQDHSIAAFGGVNTQVFDPENVFTPSTLDCDYQLLGDHLLLLDTGLRRLTDAGSEIAAQPRDRELTRQLANFATHFVTALEAGQMQLCGTILDAAWSIKRRFVSNDQIDEWYRRAKWEGAWGGKLCGAGGGGFLLFMAPPHVHSNIRQRLELRHVPIKVGVEGSKVVYSD